jgi:hypothetical protein
MLLKKKPLSTNIKDNKGLIVYLRFRMTKIKAILSLLFVFREKL